MKYLTLIVALSLSLPAVADKKSALPEKNLLMFAIDGGSYARGQKHALTGPARADEGPQHTVTIETFEIQRDEVTVAEWAAFLNQAAGWMAWHPLQPLHFKDGRFEAAVDAKEPIRAVSWMEARAFCRWHGADLPTEAQWERAARGAYAGIYHYPWPGTTLTCEQANISHPNSRCFDHPVAAGSFPAGITAEGLNDMSGNVSEWVFDRYGPYPELDVSEPTGATEGPFRVIRGGSYVAFFDRGRITSRDSAPAATRSPATGFRCARGPALPVTSDDALPLGAVRAKAPEEVEWSAPETHLTQPTSLATGLYTGRRLFKDGDHWLLTLDDGRMLRIDAQGSSEIVREDLPEKVHVMEYDGVRYALPSGAILRLDAGALTPLVENRPGLRGVVGKASRLYWLEGGGQSETKIVRISLTLAGAQPEIIETVENRYSAVMVRADDYLLGWEDDADWKDIDPATGNEVKPRGLYRLVKGATTAERVGRSRLFARNFLSVDSQIYLLMNKGHGWIYRYDEGAPLNTALKPLTIAHGGTRLIHLKHNAIYWQSRNAISRIALGENAQPEVLAVNTRPEDMVVEDDQVTWVDRYRGRLFQLKITAP